MTDELEQIKERWSKGTPGPWHVSAEDASTDPEEPRFDHVVWGDSGMVCVAGWNEKRRAPNDDANKIVHAPDDIANLITEVERLEKQAIVHEQAIQVIVDAREGSKNGWEDMEVIAYDAITEREELREQRDRLLEAAKPFVTAAKYWTPYNDAEVYESFAQLVTDIESEK